MSCVLRKETYEFAKSTGNKLIEKPYNIDALDNALKDVLNVD